MRLRIAGHPNRAFGIDLTDELNEFVRVVQPVRVSRALDAGMFTLRNNNREIWFNIPGNKRKLMNLQPGDDAVSALTVYFESEEGLPVAEVVKNKLS